MVALVRTLMAVPFALALAIGVSGCAASQPEPVPSKPTSIDADAIAAETIESYYALWEAVAADAGDDVERLAEVASGAALSDVRAASATWQELGVTWQGSFEFEIESAEVADDSVVASYCLDSSNIAPHALDGGDVSFESGRNMQTAYINRTDEGWKVDSIMRGKIC